MVKLPRNKSLTLCGHHSPDDQVEALVQAPVVQHLVPVLDGHHGHGDGDGQRRQLHILQPDGHLAPALQHLLNVHAGEAGHEVASHNTDQT